MAEGGVTTSIVINCAEDLEESSSTFYQKLAERFTENKQQFLLFADESRKNRVIIARTYKETITDALEACFCFEGLNLEKYSVSETLEKNTNFPEALQLAIDTEQKAIEFHSKVASLSKGLLATISTAFDRVAEKRKKRLLILRSLLAETL